MIDDKRCAGCGVGIDTTDVLCERCFKLKNYGELIPYAMDNEQYIKDLKSTIKADDLVLVLVDILNIPENFDLIKDIIATAKSILVLTKIDLLPRGTSLNKIKSYFAPYEFERVMAISSVKNVNLDGMYKHIFNHTGKVYTIGYANAGKSTLINQMLKNYTDQNYNITTSHHAGTTLDLIKIVINKQVSIIDTPGFLNPGDINLHLDKKLLKLIIPKRELKPKTFILQDAQALNIEYVMRLEYYGIESSLTFYVSSQVKIDRINLTTNQRNLELEAHDLAVEAESDIVITGLGFIKVTKPGKYMIYVTEGVTVFVRNSLI